MNGFLVDTHALLWWLADDPALPARAREAIAEPTHAALVSVASLWEIAMERRIGKLQAPETLPETIVAEGFGWLPLEPGHVWATGALPDHHRDPFDRVLIAQAIVENLSVVTGDKRFANYDIEVVWS